MRASVVASAGPVERLSNSGEIATKRTPRVALALQSARCALRLRRKGVDAGLVTCEGRLPVVHGGGRIRLGRVALRGTTVPVELGALPGATLDVGDRVFINQGASIVATLAIQIGDDSRIGDHVAIYDTDHHAVAGVRCAPVSIGRNVWLARAAIVLPGVTIGDHAVVAAGSIVIEDVPPRTLVAGNPARAIRTLEAGNDWRRI
jgi:acetyltransferase-like isoleucine patch superfamily enzyme